MNNSIILMLSVLCGAVAGCTISVVQAQTEGTTSDVVDTSQEASPTVSPNLSGKLTSWDVKDKPKVSTL